MNNREDLRSERNLRSYVESITQKSKGGLYICPLCGSGTGRNKTGAFSILGERWTCFSCNEGGDLFDLIGKHEGLEFIESERRAAELFGGVPAEKKIKKQTQETEEEPPEDFTAFYEEAHKNLEKTDYYRGISIETLNYFNVGFVSDWKHPKKPNMKPTSRLIIPIDEGNYTARLTGTGDYKYIKVRTGRPCLFNLKAIEGEEPIIICEGELDAMSIVDCGGQAIGIGGTSGVNRLVEEIKEKRPQQALIIALDNDDKGREAAEKLKKRLDSSQVPYIETDLYGKYKDANDNLINDRENFTKRISEAIENARAKGEEARAAVLDEYQKISAAAHINEFWENVIASVNRPTIPTGFKELDAKLDGGLYSGLYIIGAISSLGKTTLVLQIADQIAAAGEDVLIFSLEMARDELISKSLSRLTRHIVKDYSAHFTGREQAEAMRNAKTARGITAGWRYPGYNDTEKEIINEASRQYKEFASHIYIYEGNGNESMQDIREKVQKHIYVTGREPVVIVDYLQIIAPYNDRLTDKQNTDRAVKELKILSRDIGMPIIAISSFNRENYKEVVSMKAFKESGAIEYSSDVLIGLQLAGTGGKDFNEFEAKGREPRQVELWVLKNRGYKTGVKVNFDYYQTFNDFEEA